MNVMTTAKTHVDGRDVTVKGKAMKASLRIYNRVWISFKFYNANKFSLKTDKTQEFKINNQKLFLFIFNLWLDFHILFCLFFSTLHSVSALQRREVYLYIYKPIPLFGTNRPNIET